MVNERLLFQVLFERSVASLGVDLYHSPRVIDGQNVNEALADQILRDSHTLLFMLPESSSAVRARCPSQNGRQTIRLRSVSLVINYAE